MKLKITLAFLMLLLVAPFIPVSAETLSTAQKLKGRILLQVESRGEAYYVHPVNAERYYMANGDEAYNIMRNLGVGIKNTDLERFKNNKKEALKHQGKIFLQVESRGEAYYVNHDGTLYYLKNGSEAYNVMRNLGLGITNKDLSKIKVNQSSEQKKSETAVEKNANNNILEKKEDVKKDTTTSNEEINKKILSLNNSVFDLEQLKNKNISFINERKNELTKYPNYYQYQKSCNALINEVTSENYLIDRLINLADSIVTQLKSLLNTGTSTSGVITGLESQMDDVINKIKISQSASSQLIKTTSKDLSDEVQNDLNEKQLLVQRMETECNQPIKDMQQQIIQIKANYYAEVELIKKKPISSNIIYGQIDQLTDSENLKIDIINNQINQKILDCSSLSAQLEVMTK